jgi:phage shock protein C
MVAGVCGGVAEYAGIDATIVRLLWALSVLLGGTGVLLYVVAAIIMPTGVPERGDENNRPRPRYFWGTTLIVLGIIVLLYNLDLIPFAFWWHGMSWKMATALLLVAVGGMLILSRGGGRSLPSSAGSPQPDVRQSSGKRLHRSLHNRKIFGVCGGVGDYLDIDPTIIRLVFVFFTLASFGFGLLAYILLAIVMPEEHLTTTVT